MAELTMRARFIDMWPDGFDHTGALIGVAVECRYCTQPATVTGLPLDGFQRWLMGEATRSALPGLPIPAADLLVSGVHSACLVREGREAW